MEGLPNSRVNSSHINFLRACPLEAMSVRDLRTGILLNSHRKIFRLSSSKGIHWKEVIYQVDPQLTVSHVTLV